MADLKDLSKLVAQKSDKPLVLSSVSLQSPEDAELDRHLREMKARQELKKEWLLFILRDVVIFSCAIIFILAVGGYSLLTLFRNEASTDEKKFALSVISLIVTGLISFVTGRATALPK